VHDSTLHRAATRPEVIPLLLVEDNDCAADALSLVLHDHGYQVTLCHDGEEALDCLRRGDKPELILLDLWTPNMDGWEFRLAQQRHPVWADIPVVAMSADPSAKAAAIDADAFLHKPVEEDQLLDTLRRVLAEAQLAAERSKLHLLREQRDEADLANALYQALDGLSAARGHCRALTAEVSGISEARARAMGMLLGSAQRAAEQMSDLVLRAGPIAEVGFLDGRVDVGDVLNASLALVTPELPQDTLVHRDFETGSMVVADPAKLSHLFINLLRNAAEALEGRERPQVLLHVHAQDDETVAVSISDSGSGMTTDTMKRIFDAFFSAGRRRLAQGLGLTVARRLASEMGGRLDALSSPDIGTTFTLTLGRARVAQHGVANQDLTSPTPHVLIVADDLLMLEELHAALTPQFVVTAMRSWHALPQLLGGRGFDLVLYSNTHSEAHALSFFAALSIKHPHQAGRVVFLQNARVERDVRRLLEDAGVWQVDDSLTRDGLAGRLMRLLKLWSALGLRNPGRERALSDEA